jgi:uncharacterized protein YbbC (DUF1343 family)
MTNRNIHQTHSATDIRICTHTTADQHVKPIVKSGLDVLVSEGFASLKGLRVGLLACPASIDHQTRHALPLMLEHGVKVVRLFGAEHGFWGEAQYMESIEDQLDPSSGLPVVSLYGQTVESLTLHPKHLAGIDILVCDLQDVGSRYYTFAYTIAFAMRSCAEAGVRCLVLDRPNPIGGVHTEGGDVHPDFRSFVGEYPLQARHGLTLGELSHLFQMLDGHNCVPEVAWLEGYKRTSHFGDTGLPWVLPSPNMATPDTALVYPGACLFEGTNLSEGRGTTRPFELVGAPYIEDPFRFAETLEKFDLPGVRFRACYFQPTWDKHARKICSGVQMHVTDREHFLPLRTAVAIIVASKKYAGFDWRREPYEFVSSRLAIDLLFGSDAQRMLIEKGAGLNDVMATFEEGSQRFAPLRARVLHASY